MALRRISCRWRWTRRKINRWWSRSHSRRFNLIRIGLITALAATLFYYSPVWLWFLTALFSTFYTLKNLKRSRDVKAWKEGDPGAVPLEVFWAARRLEQEAVIGLAVGAAFFAGCWALVLVTTNPPARPAAVTFVQLVLPGVLTVIHMSIATYSWLVHHSYHAAIQFIQTDKLTKQSLERRLEEVTQRLKEANGHES